MDTKDPLVEAAVRVLSEADGVDEDKVQDAFEMLVNDLEDLERELNRERRTGRYAREIKKIKDTLYKIGNEVAAELGA